MGLFSNNKKLCPICGGPTPRLLPTKIEDIPICKECDRKIDLLDGVTDRMTVEEFRQYIAFYEENQSLRSTFAETARYDFRFMRDGIFTDAEHGLFRLSKKAEGLVFEASCLKGFQIWEDHSLLFEGGPEALRCFESDVPDRVGVLQADIDRFTRDRQEFERMERMNRMMEDREREKGGSYSRPYISEPRFEMSGPIRKFRMEIVMDHPYWAGYRLEWDAPTFNTTYPSIRDYLNEYQETVEELYALSCGLMTLLNPNAQEIRAGRDAAAPQTQGVTDAVSEIQKYKTLLDAGVITEEEFTAKKRQLLGI